MRKSNKPKSFSKRQLQWLPDITCSYSISNYPAVLKARVVTLQGASVSAIWFSPEDITLLQGVSPKHLTHVRWDLNEIKLVNSFRRHPPFLEALQQQKSSVDMHCHLQKKSGPIAPWNRNEREDNSIAIISTGPCN
ncbi:hypothetical protein TNCV_2749511 [Trichonephila clavipes]|nr:hypothetical protein TNCV_2749511 [Trichonephila clavipes]